MSIGDVLALLSPSFPDLRISKIRYLENEGLVDPERTPAGYRRFTHADVERLRYVLAVQRDNYLPLRVIREHLDAMDAGRPVPPLPGGQPGAPRLVPDHGSAAGSPLRLTRAELIEAARVDEDLVAALESYGLLAVLPGTEHFDGDAVTVARTAAELAAFGIGPRHLRSFRAAADREAGLVEQVVVPLRRQRGAEAAGRADEASHEVAALCVQLHAALLASILDRGGD